MKKIILFGILSLLVPVTLHAQEFGDFEAPLPGIDKGQSIDRFVDGDNPITRYMNVVIRFVTGGIIVIALISIVIGGYIYMTAGGDASRVTTAKSYISAALLGIVLALTAYLILNTISPQFASELQDPDDVPPVEDPQQPPQQPPPNFGF